MTVVNVVASVTDSRRLVSIGKGKQARHHGAGLDKYYLIDPWGGAKCAPGCACSRQMHHMAKTWPGVLTPLRGFSVAMAAQKGRTRRVWVWCGVGLVLVRLRVVGWM